MTVVHETPGLIEPTAFTTFGVNVKPRVASPIGFFGTGLKYAIAVLVRLGAEVTVWVGEEPHVFFVDQRTFRGKEFGHVRMRRRRGITARWMATDLPFTTELGKSWEVWMALRELHSNTLDEGGESYRALGKYVLGEAGKTRIVVSSPAYDEAFAALGEVFLPETDRTKREGMQVVDRVSPHAFYRGLRAHTHQKPAIFTWCDFSPLDLTEDRTIKHPHVLNYHVQLHVAASDDRAFIDRVLAADGQTTYEGGLQWEYLAATGTRTFQEACRASKNRSAQRWYSTTHPAPAAPSEDWRLRLLRALDREPEEAGRVAHESKHSLKPLLRQSLKDSGLSVPEELDPSVGGEIPF